MKAMLAAAVLLCGTAVRRVRGGIHLGSGSGRIGIVYVGHGSLLGRQLASRCSVWVGVRSARARFLSSLKLRLCCAETHGVCFGETCCARFSETRCARFQVAFSGMANQLNFRYGLGSPCCAFVLSVAYCFVLEATSARYVFICPAPFWH